MKSYGTPGAFGNQRALTSNSNHRFGKNNNEKFSALRQFASDQLTLISQKESEMQQQRMAEIDEALALKEASRHGPASDYNNRLQQFKEQMKTKKPSGTRSAHSLRPGKIRVKGSGLNQTALKKAALIQKYGKTDASSGVSGVDENSGRPKTNYQSGRGGNLILKYGRGGVDNFDGTGNPQVKGIETQPATASGAEGGADGLDRPFKKNVPKVNICRQIRDRLRKELWYMYRGAEQAYGGLDFTGLGYITEKAFLESNVVQTRLPYTREEIQMFFREFNLFNSSKKGLDFDDFKKNFFPHLYLVQDAKDDAEDIEAYENKAELLKNKNNQPQVIEDRLKQLESRLKIKFSSCFESVRKAFLSLDTDYDGFVTVEDILKYFANEKDINFNDLQKLIHDKDHKKVGRLGYQDFSKWLGNSIHQSEGFYFRHDSVKNPQLDRHLEIQDMNKGDDRAQAAKSLMTGDIEAKILEKFKFQWKTLRKAFMDLNIEKTGKISRREFKFYLNFWGMDKDISKTDFERIFNKFDLDGDGLISYKDFQLSIGSEMFPSEGLYFRQDKKQQCRINSCNHEQCWQPTLNNQNYCTLHQKMHQEESLQIFTKIFNKIGKLWRNFISDVKANADPDDESQIHVNKLTVILGKYRVKLSPDDKELLLQVFPGKQGGENSELGKTVNIARLYDQKYNILLESMYNKVDVEHLEAADEPQDINGYLGRTKYYRKNVKLTPVTEDEFIQTIHKDNKLEHIMLLVRQIDQFHNGYVTKTELDDIIKLTYPDQLGNRDLSAIIKKFSSIQNKILIDYKGFRDWIKQDLKRRGFYQEQLDMRQQAIKTPQSSSAANIKAQQIRQKISSLQDRVEDMKQNERQLQQQLQDYNDYKQSQQASVEQRSSLSRSNFKKFKQLYKKERAKSCLSGQRSLTQNETKELEQPRSGRASIPSGRGSGQRRPATSNLHSRTISRAKNELQQCLEGQGLNSVSPRVPKASRNENELQNYDDGRGQDGTPRQAQLVSIADYVRNNSQAQKEGGRVVRNKQFITLDNNNSYSATKLSQEFPRTHSLQTLKHEFQSLKQNAQNLYSHQPPERRNTMDPFAATNNEKDGYGRKTMDQLQKLYSTVQPTDDETMAKIVGFASDADYSFMRESMDKTRGDRQGSRSRHQQPQNPNQLTPQAGRPNISKSNENLHSYSFYAEKRAGRTGNGYIPLMNEGPIIKTKTQFQKQMVQKLGYEWKNIYRALSVIDDENTGFVPLFEFESACEKAKVTFTQNELLKLYKAYGDAEFVDNDANQDPHLGYRRLSIDLGLHKDSYNYLNQVHSATQSKNIRKLKQYYQSIEGQDGSRDHSGKRARLSHLTLGHDPVGRSATALQTLQPNSSRAKHAESQKQLQSSSQSASKERDLRKLMHITRPSTQTAFPRGFNAMETVPEENEKLHIRNKSSASQNQMKNTSNGQKNKASVKNSASQAAAVYGNTNMQRISQPSGEKIYNLNLKEQIKNITFNKGQNNLANRLTEQVKGYNGYNSFKLASHQKLLNNPILSTADAAENAGPSPGPARERLLKPSNSKIDHIQDDIQVSKVLQQPRALQRFREMVVMHLKKNDLSTSILPSDLGPQSGNKDVILPINSLKQCLQVIGLNLTPDQIRRFAVKADVAGYEAVGGQRATPQVSLSKRNNPSSQARQIKSGYGSARAKIKAVFHENGTHSLGINVNQFMSYYI